MKKYFSIGIAVLIAFVIVAQADSFAVTKKHKYAYLSKVKDGEVSNKLLVERYYSKSSDRQATKPQFTKKLELVIEAASRRIDDFWYSIVLPILEPRPKKWRSPLAVE